MIIEKCSCCCGNGVLHKWSASDTFLVKCDKCDKQSDDTTRDNEEWAIIAAIRVWNKLQRE